MLHLDSSQGLQIGERPREREGLVSTVCVCIFNMRIEICTDSILAPRAQSTYIERQAGQFEFQVRFQGNESRVINKSIDKALQTARVGV